MTKPQVRLPVRWVTSVAAMAWTTDAVVTPNSAAMWSEATRTAADRKANVWYRGLSGRRPEYGRGSSGNLASSCSQNWIPRAERWALCASASLLARSTGCVIRPEFDVSESTVLPFRKAPRSSRTETMPWQSMAIWKEQMTMNFGTPSEVTTAARSDSSGSVNGTLLNSASRAPAADRASLTATSRTSARR